MRNEAELHQIWKSQAFDRHKRLTEASKEVTIIDPGKHNFGDGPDFLNARIRIGDLLFAGDVELHLNPKQWYLHHHHTDVQYNRVVLHVSFYPGNGQPIFRADGTQVPNFPLRHLIHASRPIAPDTLPCSGHIHAINNEVIRRQAERASRENLQRNIDHLMRFYPAEKGISEAVKQVLTVRCGDIIGKPSNSTTLVNEAEKLCNAQKKRSPDFRESRSEHRPANRLHLRTRQLQALYAYISEQPLPTAPREAHQWISGFMSNRNAGFPGRPTRRTLLRHAVVPALALWADVLHAPELRSEILTWWSQITAQCPRRVKHLFQEFEHPHHFSNFELDQYKAFCSQKRCSECLVMKASISA